MNQMDLVIEDFKKQISRLSEERALYFTLATDTQQKNGELQQENETLKEELDALKKDNEKSEEGENE